MRFAQSALQERKHHTSSTLRLTSTKRSISFTFRLSHRKSLEIQPILGIRTLAGQERNFYIPEGWNKRDLKVLS